MSERAHWYRIKEAGAILLGSALLAFYAAAFIIPHNIITGGATGIGLVLSRFLPLDAATIILIFNVLMLLLGGIFLGKKFLLTTITSSLLYPLFLALLQKIPGIDQLTDNTLLAALFSGGLLGLSMGIVMRIGSSTGGVDVINLIINKWFHFPLSLIVYINDLIILGTQALFSTSEQILYGVLVIVIASIVLDQVMITGQSQLQIFVVTEHYELLRDKFLSQLNAGVTMMLIETGCTHIEQKGVLCVIPKRKLHAASKLIQTVDPRAFITITQIKEVRGQGFTLERLNHYRKMSTEPAAADVSK